jgi:hypothetical protein
MSIEVPCPGCGLKLKAPDDRVGKKAKCKKCGTSFRVPGPVVDSVGESQQLSVVTTPEDEDVPMAAAAEEFDDPLPVPIPPPAPPARPASPPAPATNVAALPSADAFDFSTAPKAPARTASGAAKSTPAAPGLPPKPAASSPPKPPPAPPPLPPKAAAVKPAPEVLSLDDEEPAPPSPPAVKKSTPASPPAPPPAPEPKPPASNVPFTLSTDTKDESKIRKKKRDEEEEAQEEVDKRAKKAARKAAAAAAAPLEEETAGAEDPFGFYSEPAPKSETKSKKQRDEEEEAKEGHRYRRPEERPSGVKPLLIAVVLALAAIGAVVGAVMVNRRQAREAERIQKEAEQKKKDEEKKKDEPEPTAPEQKAEPKKDTPKKDPPKDSSQEISPKKDAPKELPPKALVEQGMKTFQFRPLSAKPEVILKPNPPAIVIAAPFAKVKRVFVPADRRKQDVVVVWQSNPGVGGKGEKLSVDIHSGANGGRILQFDYDGDGKDTMCDVSADMKFFAAVGPDDKISVWNLADKSKVLEGFSPYADVPGGKKPELAAIYFAQNSAEFVTVSTAGVVQLIQIAGKAQLSIFAPPGTPVPGSVIAGKNVATDDDRKSIVLAVGESVYQISTVAGLPTTWKLDLGEVGRPLGIAVLGIKGQIAYAFETIPNAKKEKEKVILFCTNDKDVRAFYRWPDAAGEPVGAMWAGPGLAAIPTERGVVYVQQENQKFTPFALGEVAGGKGPQAANEQGHWYLTANAADPGKSMLVELKAEAIGDLKGTLAGMDVPRVKLDDKGLSK